MMSRSIGTEKPWLTNPPLWRACRERAHAAMKAEGCSVYSPNFFNERSRRTWEEWCSVTVAPPGNLSAGRAA